MEQLTMATVEEAYAAFSNNDIPALLDTLSEGVDWLMPGPPNILPYAGPRRGRQQVAAFFVALSDIEQIELFRAKDFIEGEDEVIVLGEYRARVKSTGQMISLQWVHVLTLSNGKIDRLCGFFDTAAAVAAHTRLASQTASANAKRRSWGASRVL
jgi:ketosteroid isomerase-like protein